MHLVNKISVSATVSFSGDSSIAAIGRYGCSSRRLKAGYCGVGLGSFVTCRRHLSVPQGA